MMNEGELHAFSIVSQLDKQNKLKMARILKAIFINDKTEYEYFGHFKSNNIHNRSFLDRHSANRFGEQPMRGKRWNTPAEIAYGMLKDLGYDHPHDVPDVEGKTEEEKKVKNRSNESFVLNNTLRINQAIDDIEHGR